MKAPWIMLAAMLAAALVLRPVPVAAQSVTPPPPTGEITGKIINENQKAVVTETQDVMLHIWDQNNTAINMLHGQSTADGTFRFTEVDLEPQYVYGVMAVYAGVTYMSQVLPPSEGSDWMELDVPVYETTTDTSTVQINQMHVLFKFAEDGVETTEIFALSNAGTRTVKDAVKLEDGTSATLRYSLPADANYIFFQPDEPDRFNKFAGGFADTSPLLPGAQGDQFAVQYVIPFAKDEAFEFTAPVKVKAINFLLPENSGIKLKGEGLTGPEAVTFETGKAYEVYAFGDLSAGQSFHITLSGQPTVNSKTTPRNLNFPLALGGGLLGLAMLGTAVWWWRRPEDTEQDGAVEMNSDEAELGELVAQIAQLDAAHERGELPEDEYQRARTRLRNKARELLKDVPAQ